ncbi:MAG: potassium-transporting ATPase subunit F [Planctomycetaceae bacterium]|nr:potassium-transporting ATPase subunit F [Planctomycetaceae bacterium]
MRSALNRLGVLVVLYLTAFVTVAALVYLVYAMLRPEKF